MVQVSNNPGPWSILAATPDRAPRRAASQPLPTGTRSWCAVCGHRHCRGCLHAHPCPSPASAHTWDHRPAPHRPQLRPPGTHAAGSAPVLKVVPLGPGSPYRQSGGSRPWVKPEQDTPEEGAQAWTRRELRREARGDSADGHALFPKSGHPRSVGIIALNPTTPPQTRGPQPPVQSPELGRQAPSPGHHAHKWQEKDRWEHAAALPRDRDQLVRKEPQQKLGWDQGPAPLKEIPPGSDQGTFSRAEVLQASTLLDPCSAGHAGLCPQAPETQASLQARRCCSSTSEAEQLWRWRRLRRVSSPC